MIQNYGPVRITGGYYKGRVGYYQDDTDDCRAVVYLGSYYDGECILVRMEDLEPLPFTAGELVEKRLWTQRKKVKGKT